MRSTSIPRVRELAPVPRLAKEQDLQALTARPIFNRCFPTFLQSNFPICIKATRLCWSQRKELKVEALLSLC
jgi:hypothetical protein